MTLKRLLTGKPGNLKEFVEMAKKSGSSVRVSFKVQSSHEQTGHIVVREETIYSCGSESDLINRTDLRFVRSLPTTSCLALVIEEDLPFAYTEIVERAKNAERDNLGYLECNGLPYTIFD